MNFQKLFGPLTKSREDVFDDIIGHEHIKRLFGLALRSQVPTHILLSGPPASAKTMFLLSSIEIRGLAQDRVSIILLLSIVPHDGYI
jgi:predicted ATPase with chaperone activity